MVPLCTLLAFITVFEARGKDRIMQGSGLGAIRMSIAAVLFLGSPVFLGVIPYVWFGFRPLLGVELVPSEHSLLQRLVLPPRWWPSVQGLCVCTGGSSGLLRGPAGQPHTRGAVLPAGPTRTQGPWAQQLRPVTLEENITAHYSRSRPLVARRFKMREL